METPQWFQSKVFTWLGLYLTQASIRSYYGKLNVNVRGPAMSILLHTFHTWKFWHITESQFWSILFYCLQPSLFTFRAYFSNVALLHVSLNCLLSPFTLTWVHVVTLNSSGTNSTRFHVEITWLAPTLAMLIQLCTCTGRCTSQICYAITTKSVQQQYHNKSSKHATHYGNMDNPDTTDMTRSFAGLYSMYWLRSKCLVCRQHIDLDLACCTHLESISLLICAGFVTACGGGQC